VRPRLAKLLGGPGGRGMGRHGATARARRITGRNLPIRLTD
jgi:hypothetical protein